jgi:hypothetical protein
MPGSAAIPKKGFGQGRLICFSPQFERPKELESLVQQAIHDVTSK